MKTYPSLVEVINDQQWLDKPVFSGEMRAEVLHKILQPSLLQLFTDLQENVTCDQVC